MKPYKPALTPEETIKYRNMVAADKYGSGMGMRNTRSGQCEYQFEQRCEKCDCLFEPENSETVCEDCW